MSALGQRRLCAILLLVTSGCGSCKGGAGADGGAADAETDTTAVEAPVGPVVISHAPTGLELMAPATWRRSTPTDVARIAQERAARHGGSSADEGAREGTIADLRRPADRGAPTLAAPRLVVIAEVVDRPLDTERALDREADALRALQSGGLLTLQRTSRSRRLVGGIDMGELRVDYVVADPAGGAGAPVVHRAWLGGRRGSDGAPWSIAIVVTYLIADEDLIAREVEDVLKSIHFAAPGGGAEAPP